MTAPEPRGKGVMQRVTEYAWQMGTGETALKLECGHEVTLPGRYSIHAVDRLPTQYPCPICAGHAT